MNELMNTYYKKTVVPIGEVYGVQGTDYTNDFSSSEEEDNCNYGNTYEQNYVAEEMQKYASTSKEIRSAMTEVEGVEGMDYRNNPLNVYSTYNFSTTAVKKELPIDSFRKKILDLVEINNVVIIQGPTGCGKTTQVPQFIVDQQRERNEYCNIAVTQPRKIATINVAKRVCEERGWSLGTVCGYQVGLEKRISPDMILTYMTTGVLLQKLIKSKSLQQFTHIIVDEIHERNQELDFLLLLIRRFLNTNSIRTKVILMSATIVAEEFAYYYRSHTMDKVYPAPVIHITKENQYTKTIFYLDHLQSAMGHTHVSVPELDIDQPIITESIWKIFTYLITVFYKLDPIDLATNQPLIGSVLVFLPGIHEIEEANKHLREHEAKMREEAGQKDAAPIQWDIVPLHSSLPTDDLAKAFRPAKPGHRKIILSTNIAESSITVPDTYFVIDFCMTKVLTVDPATKFMSLKLEWASHVNCDQRAGRVGRIGDGRIYRLVPKIFYQRKMQSKSIPEILRAPLERVVLQSKMLELNETPQQILALAMNPPNLNNIRNTILSLKEMGGLLLTCRKKYTPADGDLTFLGVIMANLPIDIHLSKLIALGHLFGCLDETIIIAAGCSIQNIFSIPFQERFSAYRKLLLWGDGSFSDLIALLNLYRVWQACKRDNKFDSSDSERRWCRTNFVSLKGLREWSMLVDEITQRLERIKVKNLPRQRHLQHDEGPLILKIITAGAFYPNFFIRIPKSDTTEKDAVKIVAGRSPYNTVYLTGMDHTQPGPLYIRAIKALLANDNDIETGMSVGFDGSSKIYVEFKRSTEHHTLSVDGRQLIADTITGRIPKEVYEAVRKRQLQYRMELKLLPNKEAWKFANDNGLKMENSLVPSNELFPSASTFQEQNCYSECDYSPMPTLDTQWIELKITEFVDAGHFWANRLECETHLARLEEIMNKTYLHSVVSLEKKIQTNKLYAARFNEDGMFYRCEVRFKDNLFARVLFVDYGNMQQVPLGEIYELPDRSEFKMPPMALECVLYGIQPAPKHNPKGIWSERCNEHCKQQTMNILLYGNVHSVVDNIVYVILYKQDPNLRIGVKSINQMMIEQGYAQRAEGSFLCVEDHNKRMVVNNSENPVREAVRLSYDNRVRNYEDFEAPKLSKNHVTVNLKGPFSPLEMTVYGCMASSSSKSVSIESSSINTVLLDNQPQDYHSRLLVAGYVSQTAEGGRLKLRQTTLMPNVRGLPMVLALLFCPTMRPALTADGTGVASILCGLGYDKFTNRAYYASHDLVLELDTELTEDEINKINRVRYYLNRGMKAMEEISYDRAGENEILKIQQTLKKELVELIYIERVPTERRYAKHPNDWAKINYSTMELKPNVSNDNDVWPLLWFVKLAENKDPLGVQVNLAAMDDMMRGVLPYQEITCKLCNEDLCFVSDIRRHIMTKEHIERVAIFSHDLNILNQEE
ncbi:unnamed protein product [Phyllotreta striolata]|uniref:Probable ATP-dependent RNA helicase spindle-E n=1 Tax=Phyllotreta striolata TaxID=444603 RepID=A0A9N9TM67_PHYSR|nr:unnamed protein product [Phyllotreta striolata]